MNTRPKNPANARNLNACIIGSSGSGKTRFWLTPQLLQTHSSYVCVDPKGGVLSQVGAFLQRRGYQVKVFNSIDFSKSMHYNPLSYIHNEADILKFVDTLIANTKGEGKEGDPFWTKAETLLYCALIAYIIFEAPAEDRNINTLVDMISGMDVKEDDESYLMEYSCLKTLASKHKTSLSKTIDKFNDGTGKWGIPYETKQGNKRRYFANYADCKGKGPATDYISNAAVVYGYAVNTLENRLKAKVCELCGTTESDHYEVHHINKLKNLKGKERWEIAMIAKHRKTLVVCRDCHRSIIHKK